MKYVIVLISLLSLFSGCSKEIKNNRRLDGEWKPVEFSLYDYNGLKTKPACTGSIQFTTDGKKSTTGTYHFNLLFDYNGAPKNFIEQGTYRIENKNIMTITNTVTNEETLVTIVYQTKEDLILEVPNKDYLGYYIVMKK